jgi:hypothetical protein
MSCNCSFIPPNCGCPDCNCPDGFDITPTDINCSTKECEDAMCTDCIKYCETNVNTITTDGGCYGFESGDSLTEIMKKLNNYCPTSFNAINNWFYTVANTPALSTLFCQLVSACSGGVLTGTVPVILYITPNP